MLRKIVKIDESKCNGCGLCVPDCVEGALKIVDGKARLVSDVYCDGLGACLGHCPQGAITIEQREASVFDEKAVEALRADGHAGQGARASAAGPHPAPAGRGGPGSAPRSSGCPGSAVRQMDKTAGDSRPSGPRSGAAPSALAHWPVQLRLVPPFAPFLEGADILLCADCVPFAVADFHERYLEGRVVLVGCPKFDDVGYFSEKLSDIIRTARPASLRVLRMEVPCCGGLVTAAVRARDASAPGMPIVVDTVGIGGEIAPEALPGRSPANS